RADPRNTPRLTETVYVKPRVGSHHALTPLPVSGSKTPSSNAPDRMAGGVRTLRRKVPHLDLVLLGAHHVLPVQRAARPDDSLQWPQRRPLAVLRRHPDQAEVAA